MNEYRQAEGKNPPTAMGHKKKIDELKKKDKLKPIYTKN